MPDKIRVGIAGYGSVGRGAELAVADNHDMELVGVFTRRDPKGIVTNVPVPIIARISEAKNHVDDVDVMLLCGGSKLDLFGDYEDAEAVAAGMMS